MKNVLFLFALVVLNVMGLSAQEVAKPEAAPVMTFEKMEIDYGTIDQGSDRVRKFKFTNTGDAPLLISAAKGSCGCTVPTYPQNAIAPQESGVIEVNYDTNRVGMFTKNVTLTTNEKESTHVLTIKGDVKAKPTQDAAPVPANTSGH